MFLLKFLQFIFLFLFCVVSAQKKLPFDSLKLTGANDLFADDYGNIYLYKKNNFSFTKYDSLGKQMGKLLMTVPFKVQSVQNPLTIFMFSENAQELKLMDANLNEIQKIDFRQKFGFIKMAYAEDLQQIWLLDESTKRLIQYNYREDKIINSYQFIFPIQNIKDMIVYNKKVFLTVEDAFFVVDFNNKLLFEEKINDITKLRRENSDIYLFTANTIRIFLQDKQLKTIFQTDNSKIVDKNSSSYFEIKDNKLYLYHQESNFEN